MKASALRKIIKETILRKVQDKSLLKEADYEEIFTPETMALLKGKSRQELQKLNKNITQITATIAQRTPEIEQIEREHRELLEEIAKEIVTQAYPIIKYAGIKIEATLGVGELPPKEEEEEEEEDEQEEPEIEQPDITGPGDMKRRVINGITHGAAIRGTFGLLLFREYIDDLDPELVDKYMDLMKSIFGAYDDETGLAFLLNTAKNSKTSSKGGESEAYQNEKGEWVIRAVGRIFPILVHEIEKGLYEILSLYGFSGNRKKDTATVKRVDKLENEPYDLRYGKFIFDALNKIYEDSPYDDPRIRDYFFTEVYNIDDELEFLDFIEHALHGKLTSAERRWAMDTMKSIESDLKKDDTGLEDLD